jgi:hypothetical protein
MRQEKVYSGGSLSRDSWARHLEASALSLINARADLSFFELEEYLAA